MKYIVLKRDLTCASQSTPFPKGVELLFSHIQNVVVVHHPIDARVTKVIRPEDITRIAFREMSLGKHIEYVRFHPIQGEMPEEFLVADRYQKAKPVY